MSRPINPQTAYRVIPHTTHGYTYASVQRTITGEDGKNKRRHWHLGVLDGKKFIPWTDFLALPSSERNRFVFPPEWDLSFLDMLTNRRE